MIFSPNVATHRRTADARGANFCIRFARERALYTIRVRFKLRVNGKKIGGDLNVIFYTEIHADRRDGFSLFSRIFPIFDVPVCGFRNNNFFSRSFFPPLPLFLRAFISHSLDFPFVIRYSLAIDQ